MTLGGLRLYGGRQNPMFRSRCYRDAENSVENVSLLIGDEHAPAHELFFGDEPFFLSIGHMDLSREKATELKRRLWAVLEDFEIENTPGAPEYTIALMLVRGAVN